MSYTSFRNDQPGDAQPGLLRFQRTNNFGSVAANNLLGEILWEGFDATVPPGQFKSASYIQCKAVGAPAANVPSELQFNTSFGTGTQLAMTIDQYGQVTINNPAANEATLFVTNDQTSANINLRTSNAAPTNSPHIHFTRSRVAAGDVQASDDLGRLEFRGFQGGTAIEAADIRAQAETVNGASVSGSIQFRTRPTTYAAINTRMNISADGNVTISTPVSGTALNINGIASGIAAQINNVGTSLDFSSTGQRITADMSNATHANRLAFQSNVTNGATSPFILPNGTSQTASIIASNNSTPTNSAFAQLQVDSTSAKVVSGVLGTGTLLPLELRVGNTNTAVSISTNRYVNLPEQPSFHASDGPNQNNVTGAGAFYVVNFTVIRFNVSGSYNGINTFTAPIAGKYSFIASVRVDGITALMNYAYIQFFKNGITLGLGTSTNAAANAVFGFVVLQINTIIDMAAGDTMQVRIVVGGGAADTCNIIGTADGQTYFCGQLLS